MEANVKQELLATFSERLSQAARMYLDNCSRCGLCIEACHAYASSPETRYTAVGRAQNIRRIYEEYFKKGKIAKKLNEAVELDDHWMEKVYETAYTCTGCRRLHDLLPLWHRHRRDSGHRQDAAHYRGHGAQDAVHAGRHVHRQGQDHREDQGKLRRRGQEPGERGPGALALPGRRRRGAPGRAGRQRALRGPGRQALHHPGRGHHERGPAKSGR